MRELLCNANLSYWAEFLKVSLDEVDASSHAQMTNNAYQCPLHYTGYNYIVACDNKQFCNELHMYITKPESKLTTLNNQGH